MNDDIAAEAREWIGTPFVWQQAQKGVGCDCKGLIAGVARNCGRPEADSIYGLFRSYRPDRPVPTALLKEGLAELFDPADGLKPGDVLLLRLSGIPQHLAIVTSETTAVHAQLNPNARVKESSLRSLLKLCPLDSAWRWRPECRSRS